MTHKVEVIWIDQEEAASVFTGVETSYCEDGFYHMFMKDGSKTHISLSVIHTVNACKE